MLPHNLRTDILYLRKDTQGEFQNCYIHFKTQNKMHI